ncbi:protein POLAR LOCALIZATION DURING ASYMMETRIC DIVISION AND REDISTRIBUTION-like [Malania oleifera]|uniref:protein POLAR LOCALIZATION DURING ASYMMETRIC DIVISION AND REDISTRIBUTION-like n=1 Tax=Malania oleifera TaxID=397392 RepID=UPI0025AE80EE|nr:protein POLAR LOCALIZATION DURING ASYMMETRIC DIVISION AND REDISTRIBUTION-like [Malania oleifera]
MKKNGIHRNHLRVADVLISTSDDDGGGGGEMGGDAAAKSDGRRGYGVLRRFSPRAALSRWLSSVKGSKVQSVESQRREEKEEEGGEAIGGSVHTGFLMNGPKDNELSSSNSEECGGGSEVIHESGRCKQETCFNLGVGFGLIFLIATSKNELNKMMELRTEMETFLQNVKKEWQGKDTYSKTVDSNDNFSYSTTESIEGSNANGHMPPQYHIESSIKQSLETPMLCKQYSECDKLGEEEHVKGMDQLEAELEAELERLELHLDIEDSLEQSQQQRIEVDIEDTAPRGSLSTTFGEAVDPPETSIRKQFGVCPNELERRLHEVVEARQQERIKELEAALDSANHMIREKEMEALWWKETMQLISQKVPENSQFT